MNIDDKTDLDDIDIHIKAYDVSGKFNNNLTSSNNNNDDYSIESFNSPQKKNNINNNANNSNHKNSNNNNVSNPLNSSMNQETQRNLHPII